MNEFGRSTCAPRGLKNARLRKMNGCARARARVAYKSSCTRACIVPSRVILYDCSRLNRFPEMVSFFLPRIVLAYGRKARACIVKIAVINSEFGKMSWNDNYVNYR